MNLSAEAFFLIPDGNSRLELVRGEVIEKPLNGGIHGLVTANIGCLLHTWANENTRGRVGIGSGFVLARESDTVRASDMYFIRADRIAESGGVPESFWEIPPDLVVEVVSPSDSADEVQGKIRDYLLAGTPLVWSCTRARERSWNTRLTESCEPEPRTTRSRMLTCYPIFPIS